MTPSEKWIEGITANCSVRQAAEQSLRVRFADVAELLPLAAEVADEDVEYVHQLRVCTRRSMAALKLYSDLLPKKKAKWFRKTLVRIRRAAGHARDMDVLAGNQQTLTGKGLRRFMTDVRKCRKAAQRPIVAVHRKLNRDNCLQRHFDDLLKNVSRRKKNPAQARFAEWATRRLRKTVKRFFKATPSDLRDPASLHRFRIRGKELRYLMELLAPAFPNELRENIYPVIEQLQERLGRIHDHDVNRVRFANWIADTNNQRKAADLRQLLEQERQTLKRLLRDFETWWTPELQVHLRDAFVQLISRPSTAGST